MPDLPKISRTTRYARVAILGVLLTGIGFLLGAQFCGLNQRGQGGGGTVGMVDTDEAIQAARKGSPDALIQNTRLLANLRDYQPPEDVIQRGIGYLQDQNIFIQYLGVTILMKGRSSSSIGPLQDYIARAKTRLEDPALTEKERGILMISLQCAVYAMGVSGNAANAEAQVPFLKELAKQDIPMEWGGGAANQALAHKGKAGLQALLEESGTADGKRLNFICNAIGSIQDTALIPDLREVCLSKEYSQRIRFAALSAIAEMKDQSELAKQVVLEVFHNKAAGMQGSAVAYVASIKTPAALKALQDAYAASDTSDELKENIRGALAAAGSQSHLDKMVAELVSPKTPFETKNRILADLEGIGADRLNDLAPVFSQCLTAADENGEPQNHIRVQAWLMINSLTTSRSSLELKYRDEDSLQRAAGSIIDRITRELEAKHLYNHERCRELAIEECKRFIRKWTPSNGGH